MLDYSKGWGIKPHAHEFYQLYYITSGEGDMSINGEWIHLFPKLCVLIRPGQEHELFKMRAGTLRMIDVKFYVHDEQLAKELQKSDRLRSWGASFRKS